MNGTSYDGYYKVYQIFQSALYGRSWGVYAQWIMILNWFGKNGYLSRCIFLFWRLCKNKLPTSDFLVNTGLEDIANCIYCDMNVHELFEHHFVNCIGACGLWSYFAATTWLQGPFLYLKDIIFKW